MFVRDTIERVARTVVQSAAAAVLALWISAGSFDEISWNDVWKVAVFAGGLSILMALAGKGVGNNPDSGSVLDTPEG